MKDKTLRELEKVVSTLMWDVHASKGTMPMLKKQAIVELESLILQAKQEAYRKGYDAALKAWEDSLASLKGEQK